MNIFFQILIHFSCHFIGEDEYNNKYYSQKKTDKRFIIFNGKVKVSLMHAMWRASIRKITSKSNIKRKKIYELKKEYLPNLIRIIFTLKPQKSLLDKDLDKNWRQIMMHGHLENNYEI